MKLRDLIEKLELNLNGEIGELNKKMDTMLQFRWQIMGGAFVASLIVTALFNLLHFLSSVK